MKATNHRFATEIEQPPSCQRQFDEHGQELIILCDDFEDGYPVGRIFIGPAGIRIELDQDERNFPVTVARTIVKTA